MGERPVGHRSTSLKQGLQVARKTSRDKRLKFFSLGNTHCPICLASFTEVGVGKGQTATLEHAPPKVVGGGVVCLTCQSCNGLASATSDQALRRSTSPLDLEIDVNGTKRTARFWPDGIPPSRMPYRFGTSTAAKQAERELGSDTVVAATQPIQFNEATTVEKVLLAPKAPNARYVEVSYLRSAYLLVFSLLGSSGYVYARSAALGPVREQILNPDEEVATSLIRGLDSGSASGTVITLRNNARPFYWSVRFEQEACVFLPHGGSETHYRQIAALPEHQRVRGWEWPPRKFGSAYVDGRRLIRDGGLPTEALFGTEYVTVSNGERELRWVVVNEEGDAMRAGQ